jgi:hypothetical protein
VLTTSQFNTLGPRSFLNNEVYGAYRMGIEIWNPDVSGGMTIDRPVVWHSGHAGVFAFYSSQPLRIIEPQIYFQSGTAQRGDFTVGIRAGGTGDVADFDVQGGAIHGATQGIRISPHGQSRIEGTEFANDTNILVFYGFGVDPTLEIVDPVFRAGDVNVDMFWAGKFNFTTTTILDRQTTLLELGGKKYQLYYYSQAADFVVPETAPGLVGSPEAGLTNRQTWAKYGIAIAGSIAPDSSVEFEGINGLVSLVQ